MTTNTNESVTRDIEPDGRCNDPDAEYQTPFRLGDLVVDKETCDTEPTETDETGVADGLAFRHTTETSPAIVVREGRARACDVFIDGDTRIADVDSNRGYPADAPLVTVVFVGALDRTVNNWRQDWEPHTLDWRLDEFKAEWGVHVKTYDYPAGRLVHADDVGLDPDAILDPIADGDDAAEPAPGVRDE